jgi:carbonic anhydrase
MTTMNISRQDIAGECNLKCDLRLNYSTSNCSASNYGNMIVLSYDNPTSAPVRYNNSDYNVQDVNIVSPSRHYFNGDQMPGEIFINHVSKNGSPGLTICIPIVEGSISSKMIDDIVTQVSTGAANSGETTVVRTDYNLENIVPLKPFFNYTASNREWVVYGIVDAIKLNSGTIDTLKRLISAQPTITDSAKLYINVLGPNKSIGDGQIYIDCQPTGSSEETENVESIKVPDINEFTLTDILKNPIVLFLLSGIIFYILIFGLNAIYNNLIGGNDAKIIKAPSSK